MSLVKSISRFEPLLGVALEECERHYVEVHVPFVRRAFSGMAQAVTYHPQRAVRQLDVAGGWNQRPAAWRFVVARFDSSVEAGADWARVLPDIELDHTRFLRNLRLTVVTERVCTSSLAGQTALEKYLLEVDADSAATAPAAREAAGAFADALAEAAARIPGIRQVVHNEVEKEGVSGRIEDEGQGFALGRFLPGTDKAAYVEVYADNEERARELFASVAPELAALRGAAGVACADVYQVQELCGVDKR